MAIRKFLPTREGSERGQALVLFALMLVVLLGFVGLSIDVGRYMWAKGEMKASVDSAALAGAQSMQGGLDEATQYATEYWNNNKAEIVAAGENVSFTVTFPEGNRAVKVEGEADIPTWFVKFFGVENWHVSAQSTAESQVLDIAVVFDVSGSMCFTSYPPVEGAGPDWKGIVMAPGRVANMPTLAANPYPAIPSSTTIPASTGSSIVIKLNDTSIFNTTSNTTKESVFGDYWETGTSKKYHEISPNGGRAGIIRIGGELMKITAVDNTARTLTVTRSQYDYDEAVTTTKETHAGGAEIWTNKSSHGSSDYCDMAAKYSRTSSTDGPHEPFDAAMDNAEYFIDLFNGEYDRIGLARYSSTGTISSNLTGTFSNLTSALNAFPYPSGGTNIAHGISKGRQILDGTGKRSNAIRIIVLVTDGAPTHYCGSQDSTSSSYGVSGCSASSSGNINACPSTPPAGMTHAINQAAVAAASDTIVYTIGLGEDVIDCILEDIAEAGGGTYYKAPTPGQLDEAFLAIAEQTHIGLTD